MPVDELDEEEETDAEENDVDDEKKEEWLDRPGEGLEVERVSLHVCGGLWVHEEAPGL